MPVPSSIIQLIQRFDEHRSEYLGAAYNETQLRREFLDPFFAALGWDMYNLQGYAEAYKDVIHEDSIRVGGATQAPDYAFRIGKERKFFVEAKKPSIKVKDEVSPAYQLRRYAWSAKLPLSILTDFEEFAVYDCRSKPVLNEKASTGRVMYLTYQDYTEQWDKIAAIFARDAVLKGSFDQYAEATRGKHGTAEVDDAFLAEIEHWRDLLAHNIALRNSQLTSHELNYAVQMTIDRIIFLRISEDRGIENYGQLQALLNGGETYARLCQLFKQADQRYNSGLFHFYPEKGQVDAPDSFCLGLDIDDKPLKDILTSLYYPDSPYEFSVLPADILGQVYEQFLGKVIRLTAGHHAVIDDKPEVKKAGGVYYTPTYIVDYIVKHTVGKLLEGRKPGEVGAGRGEPLRILDPACGSGSFLLGAYQYLLDWYRDGYAADGADRWAKGKKPTLYQAMGGEWKLTTGERKRILLQHIYGVDIDAQAVEVTKLSLLLKVLEGESEQTLGKQLALFSERALPDLGSNIKCGNSLIGPDFYHGRQLSLLDEEERYRINVFDWQAEFAPVFLGAGGFDAVIGNPPYIRIQALKEWAPLEVEFYKKRYQSASKGNYDIYVVFVEKGLTLLSKRGRLGYILPNKFFNAQYGESLRSLISDGKHLEKVVHFSSNQIFENATTYTCLLFLDKENRKDFEFSKVDDLDEWQITGKSTTGIISLNEVNNMEWNFNVGKDAILFNKLHQVPLKLDDIVDIFVGLQTSADDIYIMDFIGENEDVITLYSKSLQKNWSFEKSLMMPLVSGTDVNRYSPLPSRQFILFPYKVINENAQLISFKEITSKYPLVGNYLLQNKKRLEEREGGKFTGVDWHRFGRNQNVGKQERIKLCVPRLVDRLYAAYDELGNHYLDNVDVGGLTLKPAFNMINLSYILGLLNSRLLRWYFPFISASFRGGWLSANRQFLSQLPILIISFEDKTQTVIYEHLITLVECMLTLHKQIASTHLPHDKKIIQRQIDATDKEIDVLVYELYDLSEDEIKIVEGG